MSNKIKLLVLSLTGKCNFSCRYCYASGHNKGTMSSEIALAALRLAEAGGERFILQFSGGEPLLNFAALQAAVDYVRERRLPAIMQIQTNASLLTDEIAQYLYQNKVAIGVSLDGRAAVNDRLRLKKNGYGATGVILRGIEVLRRNNIACGITCVVTEENVHELAGLVDFAYFLGNIRKIGFDILRRQGRGSNLQPPSAAAMRQAMEDVYTRRAAMEQLTGIHIAITQQERVRTLCRQPQAQGFGHCQAMNGEAAFVDARGDIYACSSLVGNKDFLLGNVCKGISPLLLAKAQAAISTAMDFCRRCTDFPFCGGGCFARWYGMQEQAGDSAECAMQRVSIEQVMGGKEAAR